MKGTGCRRPDPSADQTGVEMAVTTTTIELDRDVADFLAVECKHRGKTLVEVANEKLRESMLIEGKHEDRRDPVKLKTFKGGFAPGVDPTRLNQLYDQMEIDDYIRKTEKRKAEL